MSKIVFGDEVLFFKRGWALLSNGRICRQVGPRQSMDPGTEHVCFICKVFDETRSFTTDAELQRHLRRHFPDSHYYCRCCSHSTASRSNMKRHFIQKHPDELSAVRMIMSNLISNPNLRCDQIKGFSPEETKSPAHNHRNCEFENIPSSHKLIIKIVFRNMNGSPNPPESNNDDNTANNNPHERRFPVRCTECSRGPGPGLTYPNRFECNCSWMEEMIDSKQSLS